jgi:transposase-like protein
MRNRDYTFRPADYVSSYRDSGLSRRAYGRLAGVPESTLREWEKAHSKTARISPAKKTVTKAPTKNTEYEVVMNELSALITSAKRIQKILTSL